MINLIESRNDQYWLRVPYVASIKNLENKNIKHSKSEVKLCRYSGENKEEL